MKDILKCLCRLCARKDEFCVDLFDNDEQKNLIRKKIGICLPVTIQQDDGMPRKICFNCINKLEIAYDLYYSSLTAQTRIKRLVETEPGSEHEAELFQVEDEELSTHSLDQYLTRKRNSSVTTEIRKVKRRAAVCEIRGSEYLTFKPEPPDMECEDILADGVSIGIQCNAEDVTANTFPPSASTNQIRMPKKRHAPNIKVRRHSELQQGAANGATHSTPSERSEPNGTAQTVTAAQGVQPNLVCSQAPSQQANTSTDMLQNSARFGGTSTENQTVPPGVSRVILVQEPPAYSLGTVYNANGWPIATNVPVMNNMNVQQPTHFLPQRIIVPPQMVTRTPQTILTQVTPATPILGDPSQLAATTSAPVGASASDLNGNNQVHLITNAANPSVSIQTDQVQDSNVINGVPTSFASNTPSVESNILGQNAPPQYLAPKSSSSKINGIIVSRPNNIAQVGMGQVRYAFAHMPPNATVPARFQTLTDGNATQITSDSNALPVQGEPIEMSRSGNSFNLSTGNIVNGADLRFRVGEVPIHNAVQAQLPHTSRIHILSPSISNISFQPSSSSNVNSTLKQIDGQHNLLPQRNVLPVAESTKMKTKTSSLGKRSTTKVKCYSNKKHEKEEAVKKRNVAHTTRRPRQQALPPSSPPHPLTEPVSSFCSAEQFKSPRRETSESVTQTNTPDTRDYSRCASKSEYRRTSDQMCSQSVTPVLSRYHLSQRSRENNLRCHKCRPTAPESPEDVKPELYIPEYKPNIQDMSTSPTPTVIKEMCPLCRMEFEPDLLIHHRNLHFKERFYTCLECNKNFVTELGLESHRCPHKLE